MFTQLLTQPTLGFFLFTGIGAIISLILTIFWIWMLVDCLTNRALTGTAKIVWFLVVFFFHFIGALLYFFLARGGRAGTTGL